MESKPSKYIGSCEKVTYDCVNFVLSFVAEIDYYVGGDDLSVDFDECCL